MNYPTKAGDRYKSGNLTLTAKCFFGESGHEFPTAAEAKAANNGGRVLVKNVEYEGATQIEYCELIK